MIQKKWALGLLFGVMLTSMSINLMSSQADKNAFRALLVKANSDMNSMDSAQLDQLHTDLKLAANRIGSTNVSSLSRNAGLRYNDVLSAIESKMTSIGTNALDAQIRKLRDDLSAATAASSASGLASVQAELATAKAELAALVAAAPGSGSATQIATLNAQVAQLTQDLADAKTALAAGKKSGPVPVVTNVPMSAKKLDKLVARLNNDTAANLAKSLDDGDLDASELNTALGAYVIATPADAQIIYDFVRKMAALYDAMKALTDGATVCTSIVACMNTQLNVISTTFKFPLDNLAEHTNVNDMLEKRFDKALSGMQFGIEGAAKVTVDSTNYLDLLTKKYVTDTALTGDGYTYQQFADVIDALPDPAITANSLKLEVARMWSIYSKHLDTVLRKAIKDYLDRVMAMQDVTDLTYSSVSVIEKTSDELAAMDVVPTYKIKAVASAWDLDSASAKITEISKIGKKTALSSSQEADLNSIYTYLVDNKDASNPKWVKDAKDLNAVLAVRKKQVASLKSLDSIDIK